MSSTISIQNFNKEQLVPILGDLQTGISMMGDIMEALTEYRDVLYEITSDLKDTDYVTDELKAKIDKNVAMVMANVQSILNKCVQMSNVGKNRGTLLDRMRRGYTYKYKTLNGIVAENPEPYIFDIVRIDVNNRIISVGEHSTQIANTDDYEPGFESGSLFETAEELAGNAVLAPEARLDQFVKGIEVEVQKVLILQSHLDVIEKNLQYFNEIVESDVIHFSLFERECLDAIKEDM
jgi:hypothetical protein